MKDRFAEIMNAIDIVVDALPQTRKAVAGALIEEADTDNWATADGYREQAKITYYGKAAKILALDPTEDIRA